MMNPSDKQILCEEHCSFRDRQKVFQYNKALKLNCKAFGKIIV